MIVKVGEEVPTGLRRIRMNQMTLEAKVNWAMVFLSNSGWSDGSGQGEVEPVFRSRRSVYHHDHGDQEEHRGQQSGRGYQRRSPPRMDRDGRTKIR